MHDKLEKLVLSLFVLSTPFYAIRHPRKAYNLIVHKEGWFD